MNIFATLSIAFIALTRNKMRSLLTVLGIVIGIAAVIAMVAIGNGAKARVEGVFSSLGTNLLTIRSGNRAQGGVAGGAGSAPSLTWDDVDAIAAEVSTVKWVAPVLQANVQAASEDANWNTTVVGTTPPYLNIRNWTIGTGVAFDDGQVAAGAKVALIGTTVARELYGETDPLGQSIRIKGQPFEIIAVLKSKGQGGFGQDYDDTIIIPTKTFQSKIAGGLGRVLSGQIQVSATSDKVTSRAEEQITSLLRDRHKIEDGEENDFEVRNMAEFAAAQKESTNTITTLLAAVAAVSLLVGGIGVMNIMLVSVIERTREIGIRMAVGATPSNVLSQFLAEAMVLSIVGGILGLGIGWLAASKMAQKFGWSAQFPTEAAALAFAVSAAVGILFGLYPALKASRLNPITALRYES